MSGYYSSAHWRELRERALKRDGYSCVTPGCRQPARTVDHIKTRPRHALTLTPADVVANLRSFCAACDSQVRERPDGSRPHGGTPTAKGCDVDGWPKSPLHHWRKG